MTGSGWMLLLVTTAAGTEPPRSTLQASTLVDRVNDRCLDHAVKELGMSAKQVENERRWTIGPQFLHPAIVPEGRLSVEMRPAERQTLVEVTAQWPGPAKEKAVQAELEDRISAIAGKIAQICGVITPAVRCTLSDAGAAPGACKGH